MLINRSEESVDICGEPGPIDTAWLFEDWAIVPATNGNGIKYNALVQRCSYCACLDRF
jgi:hypothetical protein